MKFCTLYRLPLVLAAVALMACDSSNTGAEESASQVAAPDLFTRFDADGDGVISQQEFPGSPDRFTEMDTDGDGVLTREEFPVGTGRSLAAVEAEGAQGQGGDRDDADGDDRVSREEFSGPADLFDQMDTDGDGYLTRAEARPPERAGRGPGKGPGPR